MKKFRDYLLCVLGAGLVAAGVYFFKFPNNFSTGGITGISIILSGYFGISSAGTISSILNLVMLTLGFIFLGKECGAKTIVGSLTFSACTLLFENLIPLSAPLTDEPLLELFFGIGITGLGTAILFNSDGSSGGTEIIALILRKYTTVNTGTALLFTDSIITCGSFLFGAKTGLYAVFGLIVQSFIVDGAIERINLSKCFSIITDKPQEISDYITQKMHRGTTIVAAEGGFTREKRYIVMAAMKRYEAVQLRRYLREAFPGSFIMITDSSEIIGRGFRVQ